MSKGTTLTRWARVVVVSILPPLVASAQQQSCRLRDAASPTDSVTYVLCEPASVMATTDGGATWAARDTGAKGSLRTIAFMDANRGFVAGDAGLLLATGDGGKTWQARPAGTTEHLTAISIAGESVWVAGYAGVVLHSSDGGRTWSRQTTGTALSLESIFFLDPEHGWAVGWSGTIIRTTDGGQTWALVRTPAATWSLSSVYFRDAKIGWTVGFAGQILRSRDGGVTWEAQASPAKGWLTSVIFDSSNHGWITVDRGLLVSEDGGDSWHQFPGDDQLFLTKLVRASTSLLAIGPFGALKQAGNPPGWRKLDALVPSGT